jgi:DNA-binding CsgD family transcriptional regulator
MTLRGRRPECEQLDALLADVRAGRSRALVLRGEAGIGKTALLDHLVDSAEGFRVARAGGVQSEMELAFAGLHQLCREDVDRLDGLPAPQANALGVVFGERAGDSPDQFLVGLAILSLLSDLAEERPLLCVVDDAQWLDQASTQALAFVARRLGTESIALVFGARELPVARGLVGLPELIVDGLSDADAREFLTSVFPGKLDERVRDRVVAETRGNPLALLELPRGIAPAELAGGFGMLSSMPLSGRIEESFQRREAPLPPATRLLLLLAAAEPVGDPALLWRAGAELGVGIDDAAPAEAEGLIRVNGHVVFRHPLVRSAVYGSAPIGERQRVHRALAEATDAEADPDRRAWHRAEGAPRADEAVADDLEHSAERARARGGVAAAAAFLERAAQLTPDPARRAQRALAAAHAKQQAGSPDAALGLLAVAEEGPLDEEDDARVEYLRAQIAFHVRRGGDAPQLLLNAAKRLEAVDVAAARETYLEALQAALFAGRLGGACGVLETAEAVRGAPAPSRPPAAVDLLLDGLATRFTDGYEAAAPTLKSAIRLFREADIRRDRDMRWLWLVCRAAIDLWDDDAWYELNSLHVQLARDSGALTMLPFALHLSAAFRTSTGEFATAATLIEEANAITAATGNAPMQYNSPVLAAWRGQETQTAALIDAGVRDATTRDEGRAITITEYSTAVLENGLGHYDTALVAAQRAFERDELAMGSAAPLELIEAAARSGKPTLAADALEWLIERTQASGTEWALGTEARSRALLSDGEVAENLFREAIDRLARCRVAVYLGRAHLVYGEWLRRERRRLEAREQLRAAYEMLAGMGAEAFAARAARELQATGEHARKRTVETRDQLTGQESQIAQLASEGLSNRDIAAKLFISPRTVEYHLHKVYTKLGVSSRNQLSRAMGSRTDAGAA